MGAFGAVIETAVQAPFGSVEQALRYAFSARYDFMARSPMARMAAGGMSAGVGLGGLDGFAQAGMILGAVARHTRPHPDILAARYLAPAIPCDCGRACCRGSRYSASWGAAVEALSGYVGEKLPATLPYRLLRQGVVRKHFGDKVRLGEIADACRLHRNTASGHASRILTLLRADERQALFAIRADLESAGVIGA